MGQTSDTTDNSCRLCDESCTSMHSVFERAPEGQQILHLIKDCLRLLIYRTDPLPKYICESCYTSLLNFSSFKRISYETLERQTEKLRESITENISVKLFLNALDQDNFQMNDKNNIKKSQNIIVGTNYLSENNIENEAELCAELQKAIKDSMQKSKIQENHIEPIILTNGDLESQDEDSQLSSPIKDLQRIESPFSPAQNAESQSDMELCDSDHEYQPKIIIANITGKRVFSEMNGLGPVVKKRRFVGPKSRVKALKETYIRLVQQHTLGTKNKVVKFNPLTLMGCVLNHINKTQLSDFVCQHYTKIELDCLDETSNSINGDEIDLLEENICNYCKRMFMDTAALAIHESNHMYVVLGQKVDVSGCWNTKVVDAKVRNLWYNSTKDAPDDELVIKENLKPKELVNFDDCSGRVNVIDPSDVDFKEKVEEEIEDEEEGEAEANNDHQALLVAKENVLKGEVVLIDTKATVNGVVLSEIPKDDRRTLYKSVTVNGVKRKFCPLCRYTFKDNWAIESHYFSTACHYTCRFCGVRFNKQRHEFDNHIRQHISVGDQHTTKVFASRKFNTTPRVIDENKVKARPPPILRTYNSMPKIKPLQMKDLFTKKVPQVKAEPRSENSSPTPIKESIKTEGKPQNQAYFCRKCYQVFFKLDEFNVHVVTCRGTGNGNANVHAVKVSPNVRQYTPTVTVKKEPEKISSSGRPVRNCVREIGTYADDHQEEVETPTQVRKLSTVKSPRGYECGLCSSCFPTVHSRNSHMRIHKADLHVLSSKSISITKSRHENIAKKIIKMESQGNAPDFSTFNNFHIKQEPMEPIVEIHEQPVPNNYSSTIGAVSITPLPNSSQKTMLDPSIIRLVQNNPNLTIKSMGESNMKIKTSPLPPSPTNNTSLNQSQDGDLKCYRCLSCSKPFANKSNLYFHKKNQCSGSKYPCPFCKKRFGTEAAYSSHIFYNHPE